MKDLKEVDIRVEQKPVSVQFVCPHCEEEVSIDFGDFLGIAGEPCDWKYTKIKCPKCGKSVEIDDVDCG